MSDVHFGRNSVTRSLFGEAGPVGEAPGGHGGPLCRGLVGRPKWLGLFGRGWSGVLPLSAFARRVYGLG